MLEVVANRVYWNKVFCCYAEHSVPSRTAGDACVLYSHRHQRNLISVAGDYWLGDDDGSLPKPDIVIGTVVSGTGLLPDPGMMEHIVELIQVREDDGLSTKCVVE